MSWTPKTVTPPLPSEVNDILTGLNSLTGSVSSSLGTISSLLDAAKPFFSGGTDPFAALVTAILTELQNFNNDFFGSGAFQLVIDPFAAFGPRFNEEGRGKDKYGIPLLTPKDALNKAIRSFDDQGDEDRPQFSDSANVSAFGLLVTAPDLSIFLDILQALASVWTIDDITFTFNRLQKTSQPKPKKSIAPDWSSLRFNQVGALGDIQKEINKALSITKGYTTVGDNVISEIIDTLQRKVDVLQASVDGLQLVVDALVATAGVPNVWVLDVPIGVGGNRRIKEEIVDPNLSALLLNKYTFMVLYVGGGPSAAGVDKIRQLVV